MVFLPIERSDISVSDCFERWNLISLFLVPLVSVQRQTLDNKS